MHNYILNGDMLYNLIWYFAGDLRRHVRMVHEKRRMLTCGHCKHKYSKDATLIRHMQTVHKDIILQFLNKKVTDRYVMSRSYNGHVISRSLTCMLYKSPTKVMSYQGHMYVK